jgi:hypothetical protein
MSLSCECGYEPTQEDLDDLRLSDRPRTEVYECTPCANGERRRCDGCGASEVKKGLHHSCEDNPYSPPCRSADCDRYECADCRLNRGEAAEQRWLSDYYGGSGPQTQEERYQADAAQKRALDGLR